MLKWLGVAAAIVIIALLVIWRAIDAGRSEPARPTNPVRGDAPAHVAVADASIPPNEAGRDAVPAAASKISADSDAFVTRFTDVVPARQTANAARCYEGRQGSLHRNASVVFKMKTRIASGVVTFHDVRVDRSTLGDPALETCFLQEVARTTWTDPTLPDWEADDELTISPERGMKKFLRDNREYAPR